MSAEGTAVRTWPGSYYLDSEKRWRPGRLSLTATHLRFQAEGAELLLLLPLSSICELKKEASSYVFSSVTVLAGGGAKHWFSSLLPSRNAVFTVLEHFWRQRLLSPQGEEPAAKTSKGAELISIAAGSQKRLEDTARVLHHQGEQFNNIVSGLNKIEGDLATADRMLSALESASWWPFSGRRPQCREVKVSAQEKDAVITTIPIIFSRHPDAAPRPGHLTLLVSALEICDPELQPLHRYERQDVDDIRVVSVHEMSVRQRFIGRPDVTFTIISARLQEVLPLLEIQYKSKVEILPEAKTRSSPNTPGWQTDSWLLDTIVRTEVGGAGEEELQTPRQEVTDSEAQELRKILMKLKSIALEAEGELEHQDEALEEITDSADRAILKINKQTRRMRDLL